MTVELMAETYLSNVSRSTLISTAESSAKKSRFCFGSFVTFDKLRRLRRWSSVRFLAVVLLEMPEGVC